MDDDSFVRGAVALVGLGLLLVGIGIIGFSIYGYLRTGSWESPSQSPTELAGRASGAGGYQTAGKAKRRSSNYLRFFLRDFVSEYAIAKTPNVSRLITTKLTSDEKM